MRFRTDADSLPGVERISVMLPEATVLDSVYVELPKLTGVGSLYNKIRSS